MHEKLQDLLKLTGDEQFPDSSELHGVLCAHALKPQAQIAGVANTAASELARWLDVPTDQLATLDAALNEEHAALIDSSLAYQLYLPDDSVPLTLRTDALAAWCGGFVSGIGVYEDWLAGAPSVSAGVMNAGPSSDSAAETLADQDKELREAIADLSQIAKASLENEKSDGSGSEEEEQAYAEIVEYVRVVVQLIQNAMQPSANEQATEDKQPKVLH